MNTTDNNQHASHCENFLLNLDLWLANELKQESSLVMQAHLETCSDCRTEAQLALKLESIIAELPEMDCPLPQIIDKESNTPHPPINLFQRLLDAWRQPLVLVPAFSLLLISILVIRFSTPVFTPTNSEFIVVNGQEYTQEEVIQAVAELELALKYLGKYSRYPAQVVRAEIRQTHLPLPSQNKPDISI